MTSKKNLECWTDQGGVSISKFLLRGCVTAWLRDRMAARPQIYKYPIKKNYQILIRLYKGLYWRLLGVKLGGPKFGVILRVAATLPRSK